MDNFNPNLDPTIGAAFMARNMVQNGANIKFQVISVFQIWDTAGQQRFKNITQTYYKGAAGIILVYSINNQDSFSNISSWLKQIENSSNENSVRILIGAKSDLTAERIVDTDDG